MSQKKNTEGKVPPTKVAPPTTIKCTKTQRELYIKHKEEIAEILGNLQNVLIKYILAKDADNFVEELNLDVQNEDWSFDQNALQFTKTEKKK